jgi:hypothetical protein
MLNMQEWAALLRANDHDRSGNFSKTELIPVVVALEKHLKQAVSAEAVLDHELEYILMDAQQDDNGEVDMAEALTILTKIATDRKAHAQMKEAGEQLSLMVGLAVVYLLIGTLVFWKGDDLTLLNAIYYNVITVTSVGLGDFAPPPGDSSALVFWIVYVVLSMGLVASIIGRIGDMDLQHHLASSASSATSASSSSLNRCRHRLTACCSRPKHAGAADLEGAALQMKPMAQSTPQAGDIGDSDEYHHGRGGVPTDRGGVPLVTFDDEGVTLSPVGGCSAVDEGNAIQAGGGYSKSV